MRQQFSRRAHLSRPDLLAAHLVRSARASNPSSKPMPARYILYRDSALTSTCDVLLSQAVEKPCVESAHPLTSAPGASERALSDKTALAEVPSATCSCFTRFDPELLT